MHQLVRHPRATVVLLAAAGLGALALAARLAGDPQPFTPTQCLAYLLPLLVAVAGLAAVGELRAARPRFQGLHHVLTLGWPVLLVGVTVAVLGHLGPPPANPVAVAPLWFVVSVLCTATFEELLCRGAMQGVLLKAGAAPSRAVLGTAGVFAVMHLANLVTQPGQVVATLAQVCYTFCLGVLLGAVYLRSRNLWVPILLHAAFNLLGDLTALTRGSDPAAAGQDLPLAGAVITIGLGLVMLVAGLVLLRRTGGGATVAER